MEQLQTAMDLSLKNNPKPKKEDEKKKENPQEKKNFKEKLKNLFHINNKNPPKPIEILPEIPNSTQLSQGLTPKISSLDDEIIEFIFTKNLNFKRETLPNSN
jgi:hypothetical protein